MKKWQDEGLPPIKNHMATLTAGLAATIKEWFSEGDHTTAIETAQKVDLEKVRVRKSRGKKTAEAKPATAETPQETPAVTEIQEVPPALETPAEPTPVIEQTRPASAETCRRQGRTAKAGTNHTRRPYARKTRAGKTYRPAGRAHRGAGTSTQQCDDRDQSRGMICP